MTEDTQQRDSITAFPSVDADWFPLIFNSSALKAHFKENFWSICFSFLTVHYRLCPFIAFLLGFFCVKNVDFQTISSYFTSFCRFVKKSMFVYCRL